MNKLKIAFVGQPEYFRCLYETDLNKEFEVTEYAINMGDPNRYQVLLKDKSDILFFFRGEFVPQNILAHINGIRVQLSSEPIPTETFYVPDRIARLKMLMRNKNQFDKFFHYDKTSIPVLKTNGFEVDGEFIFPVATNFYRPLITEKESEDMWDLGFFGRSTPYREALLGIHKRDMNVLHVGHGITGRLFNKLISDCIIGLNIHWDGVRSLEHRMQIMMACGVPVMSEPLTHNDCLKPGDHFIEFEGQADFDSKIKYYLENKKELAKIAVAGMEFVRENLSSVKCFKELINEIQK